jgi:hypothetical protein
VVAPLRTPTPGRIDPILSGLKAVLDHHLERVTLQPLTEADQLDGKTCLVTGPSSGSGAPPSTRGRSHSTSVGN